MHGCRLRRGRRAYTAKAADAETWGATGEGRWDGGTEWLHTNQPCTPYKMTDLMQKLQMGFWEGQV
eukprot:1158642-Pelagomonas_calceolata.AAC.6